jgi:DNA-directed RNA polymerase subunit RPC12/RpoP
MYATDDQVGTKVKCPDCGRRNLAKPREKKRTKRVIVPDGDEYQLDETTSPPPTPRFTPIEEREAQFRAAARARLGVAGPAVDPSEPGAKKSGGKASTEQQGSSQASATTPSPAPSPSTTRAQRRSRRDRDPRRPAVPVVQGVLRMMFTAEVMVRWMTLSFVLCGILFLILQVMGAMGNQALYMLPLFAGGCILAGIWLLSAAPLFIAITTQSSDGNDELSDPPGWLALEFAEAAYLVMAVIISALPAWLATKAAVGVPLEGRLAIGAGVWLLVFPFVVLSSLEQGSALAIFSPRLATSYVRCFAPWLVFYLTTTLLVAGAAALTGYLLSRGSLIALIPIPWLIVALILIYMRMIGRLGWWIADAMPPPAEEEAD